MPIGKHAHQAGKPLRQRARNMRLTIAFDGTAYHGWQAQKQQATIQGIVTSAIRQITGESVRLTGSGRTDAGTHARALVANFVANTRLPAATLERALNALLPRDIRVRSVREAPLQFHAQRSARSKVYRYQIYRGPVLPPHLAREYLHYPYPLDEAMMARAARLLEGTHDFASFAAYSAREKSDTRRCVIRSILKRRGHLLHYLVEADGFLHHMVRNITGTLLEVGRGRTSLEDLEILFQKRDRSLAGFTAPACGLVLVRVRY